MSKGDRKQIKGSCGTTDLPLTVSCVDQLTIGSPLMMSWRSACRPASDHVMIGAAIYTSWSLLIFTTDYHDVTHKKPKKKDQASADEKKVRKKGKAMVDGGSIGTDRE